MLPAKPILVLPSSTSKLVPCPAIFLVSCRFYHDSRIAFYRNSSVVFPPERPALAELSRRPVRSQISDITILLPYGIQSRSLEVCELSDEVMRKILKLFKHLTTINLRLLMHEVRGKPAAPSHSFFYPSFLKNTSWNFMITRACLNLDIRTSFRTDGLLYHQDARSPISHLRKLPKLTELELRVRTSKSSHSTRRSVGGNDTYTSSPAHRTLQGVLHVQETFELQNYFSGVVSFFPNVKVFRLSRAIEHRNHVRFEPIYQEEVLKLFNGRAVKPEQLDVEVPR